MPQSRIRRYLRHGTLPQLMVFDAAARLGSFSRAALELHLAQPTVSTHIRKLGETLGVPLFEQVGRKIRLTEPGRCAHVHCLEVLAVFGRLDDTLGSLRDCASGELRLAIAGAAARFVARAVAGFSQRHPGISVSVRVDNRAGLAQRFTRSEEDLFLVSDAVAEARMVRQTAVENPMVVVAHPDDPLVRRRAIAVSRIAAEPFLMREAGSATRDFALDAFARAGLTPNVRVELPSDDAIRTAIAEGGGISILPRDTYGADDGLALLDVDGFPVTRQWSFVYPVGAHPSRAAHAFLRYVRESARPRVARQISGAQNAVGGHAGPYPS